MFATSIGMIPSLVATYTAAVRIDCDATRRGAQGNFGDADARGQIEDGHRSAVVVADVGTNTRGIDRDSEWALSNPNSRLDHGLRRGIDDRYRVVLCVDNVDARPVRADGYAVPIATEVADGHCSDDRARRRIDHRYAVVERVQHIHAGAYRICRDT